MALEEGNQNARRCDRRVVEGVAKEVLARGALVAHLEAASLKVVKGRAAVGFAVGFARRHPGLNIVFSHLPLAEISGADVNNPVGKLQRLQDVFCIGQKLVVELF